MKSKKKIAIVAHDNRKSDMVEWVSYNWKELAQHSMICTGTTGRLVDETIRQKCKENDAVPPEILRLKSGPLGGDQQLGAMICEGNVDLLFFFWDPMLAQPHEMDIKALLRITVLYNVPTACSRSTADFLISSPLFQEKYKVIQHDYSAYLNRKIE